MGVSSFFVVDDHEAFRMALTRSLSAFGECAAAGSIAEAKGLLEHHHRRWAALIIDVGLPDGNGLDVLEFARAAGCSAPALVLTASNDPDAINRAFDAGARFLVKTGAWAPIEAFVKGALSLDLRIDEIGERWADVYDLSKTEVAILVGISKGWSRAQLAYERGIKQVTLKRHVTNLLAKTRDDSLLHATTRLLREAADRI